MLEIFALVMFSFFCLYPTDWSIDVNRIQDLN